MNYDNKHTVDLPEHFQRMITDESKQNWVVKASEKGYLQSFKDAKALKLKDSLV